VGRCRGTKASRGGRLKGLVVRGELLGASRTPPPLSSTILASAVKEVSKHAGLFSRSAHVPEAYRKALAAGGNWLQSLADLLLGPADPADALKRLTTPFGRPQTPRLVIAVEDLDRNQSAKFDIHDVPGDPSTASALSGVLFVHSDGGLFAGFADRFSPGCATTSRLWANPSITKAWADLICVLRRTVFVGGRHQPVYGP